MALKHRINQGLVDRCLALTMGAGGIVAMLVSAQTAIGPKEARLRERLRKMRADGLTHLQVSWTGAASGLSREERAAAFREIMNASNTPVVLDYRDCAVA